jgi:GntR family transcriptional regulator of vanillate catabolism
MNTLADHITQTLRGWVLQGILAPGDRLEEVPLAQKLGVSRTPIRAALANLGNEGLLAHQPKRGYTVRVYQYEDIIGAYEVRAVLEGLACRCAAQKGLSDLAVSQLRACLAQGDAILSKGRLLPEDHQPYQQMNIMLHETLLSAAGNSWVSRFTARAQAAPFASDRIMLWDDHRMIDRSHNDHHRIVDAVIERDAARAEQLMREHIYFAGILLKENYERLSRKSAPDDAGGPYLPELADKPGKAPAASPR